MKSYREFTLIQLKMATEPRRMGFVEGAWYFWDNKSHTVPVKARQYLGIKNERAYMLVEGSQTGIPLDECRPLAEEMWPPLDRDLERWIKEYPEYPNG